MEESQSTNKNLKKNLENPEKTKKMITVSNEILKRFLTQYNECHTQYESSRKSQRIFFF